MKYMVISDIHGGIDNLNKVLEIYRKEECNKLLFLGDLFNYGIDYNKDDIINRLNLLSDSIVAVSGNCDYDVVGNNFYMPSINRVELNGKKIVLTHGHSFTREYLLGIDCDIIYIGHSHIPSIEKINNKFMVNPGSITKSRSGDNTFAIVDEHIISIRNLNNKVLFYDSI